jgi:hypothetical protein
VLFNVLFKVFFLFEKHQIDAFLGASNGFVMRISKSSKTFLKKHQFCAFTYKKTLSTALPNIH